MLEQAMNPGNTYVVKLIDAIAHHARGEQSFLGDGNVAGTGGNDEDQAFAGDFAAALDGDDAGEGMKLRGARGFPVNFFHGGEDFGVGASDENIVPRVFLLEHGADDFGDLLRRFAFGENDFREALTQGAMMVHLGEAEVFKRQVLEAFDDSGRRELSSPHGFQKFQQFCLIHDVWPLEILSLTHRIAAA